MMSSAVLETSASALAGAGPSSLLQALPSSAPAVGAAWLVSSALWTTYSTTKFLKYGRDGDSNTSPRKPIKKKRPPSATASSQSFVSRYSTQRQGWYNNDSVLLHKQAALPRPALLTLLRFSGSLVLGLLAHTDAHVWTRAKATLQNVPHFFVPALCLFGANYSNSLSLDRIGISLTYTSKCAIPVLTVLLTLLLDGPSALPHPLALACLIPIALGIAAASWSAPTFEKAGMLAAMASATAQSALNVTSKRAMLKTGATGPVAQRSMVAVGLVLAVLMQVPHYVTVFMSRQRHANGNASLPEKSLQQNQIQAPPVWLSAMAMTAYHVEYLLSFVFVGLVQPITYGTLDAVRRLSIILSGRALFGGPPMTALNKCGIALALAGAASYSAASSMLR